jgi:hypothetical protein
MFEPFLEPDRFALPADRALQPVALGFEFSHMTKFALPSGLLAGEGDPAHTARLGQPVAPHQHHRMSGFPDPPIEGDLAAQAPKPTT